MVEGKSKTLKDYDEEEELQKRVDEMIHRNAKGEVCFPTSGFKKAMVEASPYHSHLSKGDTKGGFFIIGDLVPIKYKKQSTIRFFGINFGREKTKRLMRYPSFENWNCILTIKYNSQRITEKDLIELANLAGFHIGVGSWTPQHGGQYGKFKVK
jgi:hypothetical protein